ncbi:GNAT family N-acetyltransferase [Dongia sp.]|uniref:GNAT family N-acetyltransferase n=1 Tax=Dongia sp. TaxID=1977262 RepID=UPI0035B26A3B
MDIKPATEADLPALIRLHDSAFGTVFEGRLVADLMAADLAAISLVASVEGDVILGHILFSPLLVEVGCDTALALALAPLAVAPAHQRQGVGSALVAAGLDEARRQGWDCAVVLGHPEYYRHFGFAPEPLQGFQAPFEGPAFMALELRQSALSGRKGRIIYPEPFGIPAHADPVPAG